MLKAIFLAVVLVFPAIAHGQQPQSAAPSQPPSPSARELVDKDQTPAENNAQKPRDDQRGTNESPFVVKIQNPEEAKQEAERERDYEQRKAADDRIEHLTRVGIIVGAAQAVALFATFIIIVFVAVRQLRAYIFLDQCTLVASQVNGPIIWPLQIISAGTHPTSIVRVKNTGQTPAFNVVIDSNILLVNWPLNHDDLPRVTFAKGATRESLGPGGTRDKYDIPEATTPALTAADIAALQTGTRALFVYGEIRYRDVFGRNRFTRYRYFAGGPTGLRGMSLAGHDEGNDAT